jgi:hypothetical protein
VKVGAGDTATIPEKKKGPGPFRFSFPFTRFAPERQPGSASGLGKADAPESGKAQRRARDVDAER